MIKKTVNFKAAGVTFANRQGLLCHLNTCKNPRLTLVREKTNAYDPNAIKIMAHTDIKRFPVGYVPRNLAAYIAPLMDANTYIYLDSFQMTGGRGLTRGLNIQIHWLEQNPVANKTKI